eukprot:maker-scaffold689_size110969-snap-gene-0.20 protein:Tk07317 transcript:maker-scaffold689_size110969-snap-gene-0.20-mRNA-1 annotation:"PREDICTED: L-selectin"
MTHPRASALTLRHLNQTFCLPSQITFIVLKEPQAEPPCLAMKIELFFASLLALSHGAHHERSRSISMDALSSLFGPPASSGASPDNPPPVTSNNRQGGNSNSGSGNPRQAANTASRPSFNTGSRPSFNTPSQPSFNKGSRPSSNPGLGQDAGGDVFRDSMGFSSFNTFGGFTSENWDKAQQEAERGASGGNDDNRGGFGSSGSHSRSNQGGFGGNQGGFGSSGSASHLNQGGFGSSESHSQSNQGSGSSGNSNQGGFGSSGSHANSNQAGGSHGNSNQGGFGGSGSQAHPNQGGFGSNNVNSNNQGGFGSSGVDSNSNRVEFIDTIRVEYVDSEEEEDDEDDFEDASEESEEEEDHDHEPNVTPRERPSGSSGSSGQNSGSTEKKTSTRSSETAPAECRKISRNRVVPGPEGQKVYFVSWTDRSVGGKKASWAQARKFCRKYCMDLAGIESKRESDFINYLMTKSNNPDGVWLGGRLCSNEPTCPKESHWYWVGSDKKLPNRGDWSHSGELGDPQPDNLCKYYGGSDEECLALLNNWYRDGFKWHDMNCAEKMAFICEGKDNSPPGGSYEEDRYQPSKEYSGPRKSHGANEYPPSREYSGSHGGSGYRLQPEHDRPGGRYPQRGGSYRSRRAGSYPRRGGHRSNGGSYGSPGGGYGSPRGSYRQGESIDFSNPGFYNHNKYQFTLHNHNNVYVDDNNRKG